MSDPPFRGTFNQALSYHRPIRALDPSYLADDPNKVIPAVGMSVWVYPGVKGFVNITDGSTVAFTMDQFLDWVWEAMP